MSDMVSRPSDIIKCPLLLVRCHALGQCVCREFFCVRMVLAHYAILNVITNPSSVHIEVLCRDLLCDAVNAVQSCWHGTLSPCDIIWLMRLNPIQLSTKYVSSELRKASTSAATSVSVLDSDIRRAFDTA